MKVFSGTLADEIFAATYQPTKRMDDPYLIGPAGQRKAAAMVRDTMRNSQRFLVDDEVARAAAHFGTQHPDILLGMLPRARLPFPKVWVEWSQRVVLEELGQPVEDDCPPLIGAFVEQITGDDEHPLYRITECGVDFTNEQARVASINATSILYSLDSPILGYNYTMQDRSDISRMSGISKEMMDKALIGSLYTEEMARYDQRPDDEPPDDETDIQFRLDLCRKLSGYATHVFSPFYPSYREMMEHRLHEMYGHIVRRSIVEFSGTWRLIISLFALVQSRDYTTHEQPPLNPARRRYPVGNKMAPYLQHWRVKLALPRRVVLRRMIASTREALPRPRHGVEGHWAARHHAPKSYGSDAATIANCVHVDVAETPNRLRCALCGRATYWVKNHERGSSEVGYVTKDRVVVRQSVERGAREVPAPE